MTVMSLLDEIDAVQRQLESEFPGCKIGYIYRTDRITWTAQIAPVLNADNPDDLRHAIGQAYAGVAADISMHAEGPRSPSGR